MTYSLSEDLRLAVFGAAGETVKLRREDNPSICDHNIHAKWKFRIYTNLTLKKRK